jgi:ATP-dependent DNA helicase RecG
MVTRPEILFPLFAPTRSLKGVGESTVKNFERINIRKVRDILFTLPVSYIDRKPVESVANIVTPSMIQVEVEVICHHKPRENSKPYVISVKDSQCIFKLIYFRAQKKYLESLLPVGSRKVVSGKVEMFDGLFQIVHPDYIVPVKTGNKKLKADIPRHEPVYPLTQGLTQKLFFKTVRQSIECLPILKEWIDKNQKDRAGWPSWTEAIEKAHTPNSEFTLALESPSRERLSYDELFSHQLSLALARIRYRTQKGLSTKGGKLLRDKVISKLGYSLTYAQEKVLREILLDMAAPSRMNRLLQGDVGAGKTIVAFLALVTAVNDGGQGVIMAPTEILAHQHFENFLELSVVIGLKIETLTGRDTGEKRAKKLKALHENKIQILIGTHAVFQKDVIFSNLRLVIIDEQHRFGVKQREELINKGFFADVLVMTATPIPRSLALANYGDMEISIIAEKPIGRKPIKTVIVSNKRLSEVIEKLSVAVKNGNQAYWVCPLVEESELNNKISAEVRFKSLLKHFNKGIVGLVHGQMSNREKDKAMEAFASGVTKVLVATTVIEVGVDVPSATIMVIERAEGFGLSQLHQLRGRVGRGNLVSNCLLMYEHPLSEAGYRRLDTLRRTEDGFEIAEQDLNMRGSGDLIGTAQSGTPMFFFANLATQSDLMEVAYSDARKLTLEDPKLRGDRGRAARVLLWLMEKNEVVKLLKVG